MEWQKMLSDLAISTQQPISEGTIGLAMWIDLYKTTKDDDLKKELEIMFIKLLKNFK